MQKVFVAKTTSELLERIASFIEEVSKKAIERNGKFTVAFSGGSLPKIVGDALLKDKTKYSFNKWHIFFADERCTPLDDKESNYKNVFENFIKFVEIPKDQIHTIDENLINDPTKAAEEYEKVLRKEFKDNVKFDLILLGMGPDGHTCSLFPDHPLLKENTKLVAAIEDSPKPPPKRITLTFPVLNNAYSTAFICTGESKAQVLHSIFNDPNAKLPAQMVKDPYWFLDADAGKKL